MPVYDLGSSNSGLINDTAKGFFLRLGGWGNMAGPGLFMFRVMLSGTTSSAVLGLAGASIGALMWGTASLPFVVSSCIGFVFGATGFYFDAVQRSRIMLERYPRLLQLHLDANFPRRDFLSWRIDQLRGSTFSRSWLLQSMLICSWLTALPAIEEIWDKREQCLIAQVSSDTVAEFSEHKSEQVSMGLESLARSC